MSPLPAAPASRELTDFVSVKDLEALIQQARLEDLGPSGRDLTSEILIGAEQRGRALLRSRGNGRLSGAAVLPAVIKAYDSSLQLELAAADGQDLSVGQALATLAGSLRSLLAVERVALNFISHLSGVATLTARYVAAVAGTRAHICDTRKTIPGLRGLHKYAVVCGGGTSHRMGLFDAVLIKDNHLAHLDLDDLEKHVAQAVRKARRLMPPPRFVQVEVDSLPQLEAVLPAQPDIVLLDNMTPAQLGAAVAMRDRMAPGVLLEASGGVNLSTVRAIAESGVDRISVGALTHSAPALDVGLDVQ